MAKRKDKPTLPKQTPSGIIKPVKPAGEQDKAQSITPGQFLNDAISVLSTTDVSLTGTVAAFGKLETKLLRNDNQNLNYSDISREITELKTSISQLQELKKPIQKVEEFMKNNLEFIMVATESQGKFNVFESQLSSLEKRVDGLEEKIYKSNERSLAIWALFISIAGVISVIVSMVIPP